MKAIRSYVCSGNNIHIVAVDDDGKEIDVPLIAEDAMSFLELFTRQMDHVVECMLKEEGIDIPPLEYGSVH